MKTLLALIALLAIPCAAQTIDSEELSFLALINAYRAQNGTPALQVSATLQASSLWMSNDLGTHSIFSHTDSLGRSPQQRIPAFGYTSTPVGENIAGGFSDAQSVLTGFQNACDPTADGTCTFAHRLNMLNPGFKAIGIGRVNVPGSQYGWYWTTDFGAVVDQVITPPPPGPPPPTGLPTISSFSATPPSVVAGQPATLSWNVAGATSITINATGPGSITVTPTQSTTYTLTATNANGTSAAQAAVAIAAVPPPPPPSAGACPAAASNAFTACFYSGNDLAGAPVLVRTDPEINFTWGAGSPGAGVNGSNFSVRWQGTFAFTAGNYAFTVIVSDGYRLYIDGAPVRSAWRDMTSPSMFVVPVTITQGNHLVTLEYYEHTGSGKAVLSWARN